MNREHGVKRMTAINHSIIKKIGSDPFIELPLQALKVRRNLLLVSILTLAIAIFGDITGSPQILGIQGPQIPSFWFNISLTIITLYFTVYFYWLGLQTSRKWKLRLTGITLQDVVGSVQRANREKFTDKSIEQSTGIYELTEVASSIVSHYENLCVGESEITTEDSTKELANRLSNLKTILAKMETLASKLEPFNKSFWEYQKSYKFHWIFEFIFPLLLGTIAILAMLYHLSYDSGLAIWVSDSLC